MGATRGLVVLVGVVGSVAACHCMRQAAAKLATGAAGCCKKLCRQGGRGSKRSAKRLRREGRTMGNERSMLYCASAAAAVGADALLLWELLPPPYLFSILVGACAPLRHCASAWRWQRSRTQLR